LAIRILLVEQLHSTLFELRIREREPCSPIMACDGILLSEA
jgi:hypothetical protein